MPIPRTAQYEPVGRQGRPPTSIEELRRDLARPSTLSGGNRRRLLELAQRLSHVQALGDGYDRVCFSPFATRALREEVPTA
jgi:hypothetical protein